MKKTCLAKKIFSMHAFLKFLLCLEYVWILIKKISWKVLCVADGGTTASTSFTQGDGRWSWFGRVHFLFSCNIWQTCLPDEWLPETQKIIYLQFFFLIRRISFMLSVKGIFQRLYFSLKGSFLVFTQLLTQKSWKWYMIFTY